MALVFLEIDVSGNSYLGDINVQNKVVYQTGYTGLWFKRTGGIWKAYTAQPSGVLAAKNFIPLVPSPDGNTVYTPTYGNNPIVYNSTGLAVELYYDTTVAKFKCGRPGDRA